MRRISLLGLVTVAGLSATAPAIAGHEWTDGTMGPPLGRSYDTTMPIFPAAKKTAPKAIEGPSQVCGRGVNLNATAGPSGDEGKHDVAPQRNDNQPATHLSKTCGNRAQ